MSWSLVWEQGRALDGLDRSGFGAGWSLGASFINPASPVTVYPADGGSYQAKVGYPSGLENYPLQDLVYAKTSGPYAFTLTYDDGRVDGFDEHGNLVSRVDRFGNHTQLTWEQVRGDRWRPTTIVDGYGLTTTFAYTPSSPTTVSLRPVPLGRPGHHGDHQPERPGGRDLGQRRLRGGRRVRVLRGSRDIDPDAHPADLSGPGPDDHHLRQRRSEPARV